jgi:uncharacterized protein
MPPLTPLERVLAGYPSVLVGYSGGVDSALVAVVARRVLGREQSTAAMGVSASLPHFQLDRAGALARQFDLDWLQVETGELSDPNYVANSPERCYFCKRELWSVLTAQAVERNRAIVADGTNTDDADDHRPGARAAQEFDIRSPLVEAGYAKADVRAEVRALGIPIWDAPSSPCLSSRVLYGLSVTPVRLRQVEAGEAFLRDLGVGGDLRVRHRGDEARIEVGRSEFAVVRQNRTAVAERFTELGFSRVTLDLAGYRRGSLLVGAESDTELLLDRR